MADPLGKTLVWRGRCFAIERPWFPWAGQCGRVGAPCWLAGHQPRCLRRSVLPRAAELPAGTRGLAWPGRSAVSCSPWLNWDLCVLPCTPCALPSHCTLRDCCAQGERFTRGGRGSFLCERAAVIYCQLPSSFCVARLPFVAYLFCGTQCGCQMGLERISSRATKRTSVGERWWQIVGQHIGAAASMRTETFPAALVSAEHLLFFFPHAELKASDNLSYSQLSFSSSLS